MYCTFELAGFLLGLPASCVSEVARYQAITRVPHAPEAVMGLMNLRGRIIPAIDLRRRLGLPDRGPDARPANVVARTARGSVSFLVDAVGDVIEAPVCDLEPTPDTIATPLRDLVDAAHKLPQGVLLVLDVDRLLPDTPVPHAQPGSREISPEPRKENPA